MSAVETVRAYWERMRERNWDGVRATLASDAVAVWPETNERFAGAEAIVRVNAEYPEGWDIRVLRLVESGDTVVAEVEVPHEGVGVFRVAAFTEVVDGLIARSMEYWVQVGGAEPPAWRSGVATRVAPGDSRRRCARGTRRPRSPRSARGASGCACAGPCSAANSTTPAGAHPHSGPDRRRAMNSSDGSLRPAGSPGTRAPRRP